ncbi:MAG: hypothetical protein GY749_45870 [Desulfobacteraceae bacterium]|nr:hypothetical protein [Desulfobacteraceae bacterium]
MEKSNNKLGTFFNIRPDEVSPTLWLLIHSFCIGIALILFETISYTMFLSKFDAKNLPYIYTVSAGVVVFIGFIYSKLEERLSFSKLILYTIGALFCSIIIFRVSLHLTSSKWLLAAMLIWQNVLETLVGVEFWGLAGHIFNVRQGKRLFGLIGIGEISAGIIAGFSVPILIRIIGTSDILAISAIGMGICLIVLFKITRLFSDQLIDDEDEEEEGDSTLSDISKNRYLILLFCVSALSTVGYYIIDYIFYDQADTFCLGDEKKMAAFLGIFFAVLRIVNLISNAFVPGRMLPRYGLGFGLLAVPVIVGTGSVSAGVIVLIGNIALFFWFMAGTKLFDEVCRQSVEEPTIRILYQPLPTGQRIRAQTLLETRVEPIAGAFAGGMLLLLTSFFSLTSAQLLIVAFSVIGVWIVLARFLRHAYTEALKNAITKRKLEGMSLELDDASSIAVLKEGVKSSSPGKVIYCLNMLEEIEHDKLETFMVNLLEHEEPQVRKHVLKRIGNLGMTSALNAVISRLEYEEEFPDVLGAALRTLCELAESDAFEQVFPYIRNPNFKIRKGAMVGLLSNVGIDGVLSAGTNLNDLLDSEDSEERRFAAEVLGDVGISAFYRPLLKLLRDKDPDVRRAAIVASGNLKNMKLFPLLLENLAVPTFKNSTVAAVVNFGETVLPDLEREFDKEGQPQEVRCRIVWILGKIGGAQATDILNRKIDYSDEDTRNRILSALIACKFRAKNILLMEKRIRKEVEDTTWTLSALVDIGEHKYVSLLNQALKSEINKNSKRILQLMATIYPANSILSAKADLESNSKNIRARAFEALDNLVTTSDSREIWESVSPLLDDITSSECHAKLVDIFPQKCLSQHDRLKEVLTRSHQWVSSWTKACALLTIGNIGTSEFYDTIISCFSDKNPTVRETAIWAFGRLNPNDLSERLEILTRDKNRRVAEYARFTINSVGFASIPMGKGYLTRSGVYSVELFRNILMDQKERRVRRCRAANILSRFQGPVARSALVDGLSIADKTIRTAVLDALVKGNFEIEGMERDELTILLGRESRDAQRVIKCIATFLHEDHSERLIDALNQEINYSRKRILSILVLLSGKDDFFNTIFYWYIYQENNDVPEDVKNMLINILIQAEEEEVRNMVFVIFHQYRGIDSLRKILKDRRTPESVEELLKEIAFDSSAFALSWSRICALEMIVNLDLSECLSQIVEKLGDDDDIVRATAAWALFKLGPEAYEKHARKIRSDPSPLVTRTAKQLEQGKE